MLAYAMNGEPLAPDHGKPLRVVIPGQIGGRSVKWLKKLIITDAPSDNWYHTYDNRVLPTMVTPAMAKENPEWWKDERYAIYDLSVNSAAAYPAHGETHPLITDTDTASDSRYKIEGYAYGGGGRRITRVEISLDKGACKFKISSQTPLSNSFTSVESCRYKLCRRSLQRCSRKH